MKYFGFCLMAVLAMTACKKEKHFITDKTYRETVESDFQGKKQLLADAPGDLFAIFDSPLTTEEREAMQFLYAYAPLVDLCWYGGKFLLENVRLSLKVREEMPWGKTIPEPVFRHFVLPVRGHNESLDSARQVFYRELKERVSRCKSMEEAALEVNHWCHEKAVYRPTNARTCGPLTMTTTAYGRCGEESVFALAALRSVGIPARQVYTPRWAHCDDNHAWVEVWVDGEWKYLGACEPEPRLNIAWFTAPVRRGLYMEARVFGKYESDEETVAVNANLTHVNVTANYTDTKKITVRVQDTDRRPVAGATVQYKIYNYGEYYPAVTLTAGEKGESSLTVGKGDWIIWAYAGDRYGFGKLDAAKTDSLIVILDQGKGEEYRFCYTIVPPVAKEYQALTPDGERAVNDRRFMHEDSLRNAYIGTFMSEPEAHGKAVRWGYEAGMFYKWIKAARGNYPEILRFLEAEKDSDPLRKKTATDILDVLPEKDLQDITLAVLQDHLEGALAYAGQPRYPEYRLSGIAYPVLFKTCILNPRVKNEFLTPYRTALSEYLKKEGITTPASLLEAMMKISVNDSVNTINVVTPPIGVLRAMVTDTRSKELFFVAACRTMGIAARLNPADGKPEYHTGKGWIPAVFLPRQAAVSKGSLMIRNHPGGVKDPVYYTNFTVSKLENGKAHLIDLGSNAEVDMGGGMNYGTIFRHPVELEEGNYILVTGNRKSDGSVLSGIRSFSVKAGRLTEVEMQVEEIVEKPEILGRMKTDLSYIPESGGKRCRLQLPQRGYTALALIAADQEPTNHLLRDMSGMKPDFEAKRVPVTFLFAASRHLEKFSRQDFRPLPGNLTIGADDRGEAAQYLSEALALKTLDLPLLVVLNAKGEIVFLSQGYRVGLGNQMIRFLE